MAQNSIDKMNVPRTGWLDGLCQDYDNRLFKWFASRIDARYVLRKVCAGIAANRCK